jgi:hypothetical protein
MMGRRYWSATLVATSLWSATLLGPPAAAAVFLIDSFNPGLGLLLVAVGFDPVADRLYIYRDFHQSIHRFTRTGAADGTIPRPGISSDDFDLDFTPEGLNIGGMDVPANTLLVMSGDDSPETLRGLNKTTGVVLTTRNLPSTSAVGGSYHAERNTFFTVDFSGSDLVREINPSTGGQLNSFSPQAPARFDVFYGDVEVLAATGNLFLRNAPPAGRNRVSRPGGQPPGRSGDRDPAGRNPQAAGLNRTSPAIPYRGVNSLPWRATQGRPMVSQRRRWPGPSQVVCSDLYCVLPSNAATSHAE